MNHEHARHDTNRQQDIHGGSSDGDQKTLPPRMRHKLARISGASVHRVLARHLDVAAKRKSADAVIGIAATESKQALAEAERKDLDAHSAQFGHGVVTELVHQDHYSQHEGHGHDRCKEIANQLHLFQLSTEPEAIECTPLAAGSR